MRSISRGSWASVEQFATIDGVVPMPLKPFQTPGGIRIKQ